MQKKNGNYEKTLLVLASILAIAAVGFMIYDSQSLPDKLVVAPVTPRSELNPPPTDGVKQIIQRLKEKAVWVSPIIGGKAVPLNKSILLLQKGDQIYDLQKPDPILREPMSNEFLVKYNLDNIESPNVGELDQDNDGFSNVEEFIAKTDPRDPAKHPSPTQKLFLKSRITHDYIIKLNSTTPPYQVQRTKPEPRASKFVSPGDEWTFDRNAPSRFKALEFKPNIVKNPANGLEEDLSELKCLDLSTKREFVLIKGKETNLADYEAEFEFRIGVPEIRKVREGDTFQIPGIGDTFKVLSIEENQAVIVPVRGPDPIGEPITVKKG